MLRGRVVLRWVKVGWLRGLMKDEGHGEAGGSIIGAVQD
jgi:hypothetical protein